MTKSIDPRCILETSSPPNCSSSVALDRRWQGPLAFAYVATTLVVPVTTKIVTASDECARTLTVMGRFRVVGVLRSMDRIVRDPLGVVQFALVCRQIGVSRLSLPIAVRWRAKRDFSVKHGAISSVVSVLFHEPEPYIG